MLESVLTNCYVYTSGGTMEKSKEALRILITGETNAVKTYELFAEKAREEGYENIGLFFEVLSKAERIHIKNHLHALGEKFSPELIEVAVSSTSENLAAAISGERDECKKLYPRLVKQIKSECKTEFGKVARLSMIWAQKVEKEHARLLGLALKSLKKGKDLPLQNIYLCQVCGNIVINDLSDNVCDVCGHDKQFFNLMGVE